MDGKLAKQGHSSGINNNFYVLDKIETSDVYLVFDGYFSYNIQSGVRFQRTGKLGCREQQIHMQKYSPPQHNMLMVLPVVTQIEGIGKITCSKVIKGMGHVNTDERRRSCNVSILKRICLIHFNLLQIQNYWKYHTCKSRNLIAQNEQVNVK